MCVGIWGFPREPYPYSDTYGCVWWSRLPEKGVDSPKGQSDLVAKPSHSGGGGVIMKRIWWLSPQWGPRTHPTSCQGDRLARWCGKICHTRNLYSSKAQDFVSLVQGYHRRTLTASLGADGHNECITQQCGQREGSVWMSPKHYVWFIWTQI